jgi:dihydroflavonol-4-reductase
MKAFVTGATGLLGNNLVRSLVWEGYEVKALVRSLEKAQKQFGDLQNVEFIVGNIADVAGFAAHLEGCDVLFHTAAYFREYARRGDPENLLHKLNVEATVELFKAADRAKVKRGIFTSSSGTIGLKLDGSAGDETTPPAPIAFENKYFESKVLAEKALNKIAPQLQMEIVHILPGWMFGPGDAAPTGAGELLLDFLHRKLPGIPGGGTETVDARDVAEAMVTSITSARANQRYIVAGNFYLLKEIFATLEKVSGVKSPQFVLPKFLLYAVAFLTEKAAALQGKEANLTVMGLKTISANLRALSALAERELGARFRPLEETLSDTVAWFAENGYYKDAKQGGEKLKANAEALNTYTK